MSDAPHTGRPLVPGPRFLERVIDGAFDRVGPLEPRRPSRYEPQTIGIIDALMDHGDAFDGAPESSRRAAVTEGEQAPARHRMPGLDATVRLEVAADRDARSALHSSTPSAERPTGPPILARPEMEIRRPESVRADHERQPLTLDEAITSLLSRPMPARPEVAHARPEAGPLEGRSERVPPAEEPKPVRGEPPTPVRDRNDRNDMNVLEPRVAPPVRHDWLQARVASTPAPDPVVNVTIGRIEVRVAPAAQAPTRQRPVGAKPMGLDQYLRQRGGRR